MEDLSAVFEQTWSEHAAESVFELPWENGFWKSFFRPTETLSSPLEDFKVSTIPQVFGGVVSDEQPNKKCKTAEKEHHTWHSIVKSNHDSSWLDKREADLQVGLKRWHDALVSLPEDLLVVRQLKELPSVGDQLRMLRDVFHKKAPQTLLKRVHSFLRFSHHLPTSGILFPGSELDLYLFLQSMRNEGHPTSRLQGVMQSLNFARHVLSMDELEAHTISKRCLGASGAKSGGPKKQAAPFTLAEIIALHDVLEDEAADAWDRVFAGMVLCTIYTRSRWTDLQQAENMFCDYDSLGELSYLEFRITEHKCKWSSAFRNSFMPAVCPAYGVTYANWATVWIQVRSQLGVCFQGGFPTMPAPNADNSPSTRPLATDEMKYWVRVLLERQGLNLDERNITSHSCKCTLLSWLSKHGDQWEDRQVLGGHVSFLKSAITYSRDAMARPIRVLENLLDHVRTGTFRPDETRSGRFVEKHDFAQVPPEAGEQPLSVVGDSSFGSWQLPDAQSFEARQSEQLWELDPEFIEISDEEKPEAKDEVENADESSSGRETSSSSDESAAELSGARRKLASPKVPETLKLIQHFKLKTLHCMEKQNNNVLLCGRVAAPERYGEVSDVRFDTPLCHMCWRKKASF
eukprot:Skav227276  [mRNA]  locus=scaffold3803:182434:184323:+ [translate_table: standard]